MQQKTRESEFEPGVRELAPAEIEAVAGGVDDELVGPGPMCPPSSGSAGC